MDLYTDETYTHLDLNCIDLWKVSKPGPMGGGGGKKTDQQSTKCQLDICILVEQKLKLQKHTFKVATVNVL